MSQREHLKKLIVSGITDSESNHKEIQIFKANSLLGDFDFTEVFGDNDVSQGTVFHLSEREYIVNKITLKSTRQTIVEVSDKIKPH